MRGNAKKQNLSWKYWVQVCLLSIEIFDCRFETNERNGQHALWCLLIADQVPRSIDEEHISPKDQNFRHFYIQHECILHRCKTLQEKEQKLII